jgi:Flp pilus assembly protein TadD
MSDTPVAAADPWAPLIAYADVLLRGGLWADADRISHDVLRLAPDHVAALQLSGTLALRLGRHAEALDSFLTALSRQPDDLDLLTDCATALCALARPAEAVNCLTRVTAERPWDPRAWVQLGDCLTDTGTLEQAVASYDRALAIDTSQPDVWSRRGHRLGLLGRFTEALDSLNQALALQPDLVEALRGRLLAERSLMRHREALATYERLLALAPDLPSAHWNASQSRLALGDFAQGWKDFEWRWQIEPQIGWRRDFAQPLWLGEPPLGGRTILLHAEQGLGDTIQFCRYATRLGTDTRVVLEVPGTLKRLMHSLGGNIRVVCRDDPLPAFDLHCPLMSLPLATGTCLETIPAAVPYLSADPAATAAWRTKLSALEGLRIGLVWAGNPIPMDRNAQAIDRRRSMNLSRFAPLASVPGLAFISLQVGAAAAETHYPPPGMTLHDWTSGLGDFADTAALIEALDLVISVDTSVAHLAGALAKPVWILNRFDSCWRWLLDRTDSPWYPTARLFRQPEPGDWDSVIQQVVAALHDVVPDGRAR